MSKLSAEELERQIEVSLVARIRHAAHLYEIAPLEAGSAALQSYVAALECLAEHVAAKFRASRRTIETVIPTDRFHAGHHLAGPAKPRTDHRVIPFPSVNGNSPLTAA
jgi:hypothetical protein